MKRSEAVQREQDTEKQFIIEQGLRDLLQP